MSGGPPYSTERVYRVKHSLSGRERGVVNLTFVPLPPTTMSIIIIIIIVVVVTVIDCKCQVFRDTIFEFYF